MNSGSPIRRPEELIHGVPPEDRPPPPGRLSEQHEGTLTTPLSGWPHPLCSAFPLGLLTLSLSSRRQRTGHRYVPAVHSARDRERDPTEADSWGGCKCQQKAVDSLASGHAQGTVAEAGRGLGGWALLLRVQAHLSQQTTCQLGSAQTSSGRAQDQPPFSVSISGHLVGCQAPL